MTNELKPLKGVITDWERAGNYIEGICVWHVSGLRTPQISPTPDRPDPVCVGLPMCTSRIVKITDHDQFSILETLNSTYLLTQNTRPSGVWVPEEPTEKMLHAAVKEMGGYASPKIIYKAMLKARPGHG